MRLIASLLNRRRGARLRSEQGFTTIVVLGVLGITTLLITGVYTAAQGDLRIGQRDIEAKRAYYAARAGLQKFLFHLNQNNNHWQSCPTQAKTAVPGSTTEKYAYSPVPANGTSACLTASPIPTMIDTPTGTFRMRFIGYSGTGANEVKRGIVAGFRRGTPIDYLWYTTFETLDPVTYPLPWVDGQGNPRDYNQCGRNRRGDPNPPGPRPSFCSEINWVAGDVVNGPMYTKDQFRICPSDGVYPRFGRGNDKIESTAPGTSTSPPGATALYESGGECSNFNPGSPSQVTQVIGTNTLVEGAADISPPSNNTGLLTDAQSPPGEVYDGVTQIVLSGNQATVYNDTDGDGDLETEVLNTAVEQIIYVQNGTSGCSAAYTPYLTTYPTTGGCGTAYVRSSGNFNNSLTIGAANDIIINGNVTTAHDSNGKPTGPAMLGLVANNFVRVQHGMNNRPTFGNPPTGQNGECGSATNDAATTHDNLVIDAAILALNHSFIVDNYDCGGQRGNLTVNGAIAQKFRGTVGKGSNTHGYLKKYTYDDRLAVGQPPYMFNIADANWRIERETSCVVDSIDPTTGCGVQP